MGLQDFGEVSVVDFEFHAPPGEQPKPICMVALEYFSGRKHRIWLWDDLASYTSPPFSVANDSLMVAFFASAELGCFRAAGWQPPENILDLFPEFRRKTNGLPTLAGNGLVGALIHHGLPAIDLAVKDSMRDLAIRGGPFTAEERQQLLKYCESDVDSTADLLKAMLDDIDWPRAVLRGRYMRAVADMEWNGVPIDMENLCRLRENWVAIKERLIQRIDVDYGVYEGTTFKHQRFENWVSLHGIPWPRLASGKLATDDDTFRQMAKNYPIVSPLRELRHTLGELRLESLTVGGDGRARCLLSPFQSRTSRNQPSTTKFIFGPSCWIRGLIKPSPGRALVYADWSGQEYGIAAFLSGDPKMISDYQSGDPYLGFGKRVGLVPADASKGTHGDVRDKLKTALGLGAMYGAGPVTVAITTGYSIVEAENLLRLHRQTYKVFWSWSQAAVDHAMLHGWLDTVFGWRIHVGSHPNPRSLSNFPMQGNGAEMLRLACCLATERGIKVNAPVHDALLTEGDIDHIDEVVRRTQNVMEEASKILLGGFKLRTDAKIVRYPDRYMDKRGEKMWATVMSILDEIRKS